MNRSQVTAVCGLFFTVALAVAWATSRPLGDLYLALAGGRDAAAGGLGKPDTWSYLTHGRVWINQGWGSDLIIDGVSRLGGETGLLVLKAVLLAAVGAGVAALARSRGAGLAAALLAGGGALAAAPQDLILRPSLFSFLLVPVLFLVLDRAGKDPRWIAGGILLVALWANLHGGFIFGLAVFVLWGAARVAETGPEVPGARRAWPLAGAAAAVLAAAFANPFGWRTLVLPFTLPSGAWRSVTEWRPLFSPDAFGVWIPWMFLLIVGFAMVSAGIRWARSGARFGASGVADAVVVAVVLVMAAQAKRFVPLAAIVLAPRAALEIERRIGGGRALAAFALVLALLTGFEQRGLVRFYDPGNPFRPSETFFERMCRTGTDFPVGGATFLDANRVSGKVFQEWRWEGYLRWRCPQLSLSVGGRAQQIYTAADEQLRRDVLAAPDPAARLRALGVGITVIPLEAQVAPFVRRLLVDKDHPWSYVYVDRRSAILADPGSPEGGALVQGAASGTLVYPDSATALLSRGMCLASGGTGAPADVAYHVLLDAVRARPVDFAYPLLVERGRRAGVSREDLLSVLTGELRRLATLPVRVPEGAAVEESRERVAGLVFGLASGAETEARNLASRSVTEAERTLDTLTRAYAYAPWAVRTAREDS